MSEDSVDAEKHVDHKALSGRFPRTRLSVLAALKGNSYAARVSALSVLAGAYWKPIYKYSCWKWKLSSEAAEVLTQDFFVMALEKNFFAAYDRSKARFRTYLRAGLENLAARQYRDLRRIKRGGQARTLNFDFLQADRELKSELPPAPNAFEEYFEQEWQRHIVTESLQSLRALAKARGRAIMADIFQQYEYPEYPYCVPGNLTYDVIAGKLGISVSEVTNHLAEARREFKRIATGKLRALTEEDDDLRAELRAVFGIDL